MLSQRILQQSARRLALHQSFASNASKAIAPIVSSAFAQKRLASSAVGARDTNQETTQILINQRLMRPVSPHLQIYRPQSTWILSINHRFTGAVLSGGFYIFGALYLVAPALGFQLSTAAMVAGFAKWPLILKTAAKLGVALPFTFHSLNGLRHLVWDVGSQFTNQQVIRSAWTVVGLTFLTSFGLLLL